MRITFLYHSAFLVELKTCTLLFDWYGGTLPDFDRSKPLYVFASHHHGDHYSPEIFSLGMEGSGTFWAAASACPPGARRPWGLTRPMCSAWAAAGPWSWGS